MKRMLPLWRIPHHAAPARDPGSGASIEVDRQEVVVEIETRRPIDTLVEVADLYPRSAIGIRSSTEANEQPVLIEPVDGSPVRVVQMDEDFIPEYERVPRVRPHFMSPTQHLTESPACVRTGFEKPLFEPRSKPQGHGLEPLGPGELLPDPVLIKVRALNR